MIFCQKCGNQNEDSAVFCSSCGTKIDLKNETVFVTESEKPTEHKEKNSNKSKKGSIILMCIATVTIIAIATGAFNNFGKSSNDDYKIVAIKSSISSGISEYYSKIYGIANTTSDDIKLLESKEDTNQYIFEVVVHTNESVINTLCYVKRTGEYGDVQYTKFLDEFEYSDKNEKKEKLEKLKENYEW